MFILTVPAVTAVFVLSSCGSYLFYRIDALSVVLSCLLTAAAAPFLYRIVRTSSDADGDVPVPQAPALPLVAIVLLDIYLLMLIVSVRTDAALASPWDVIPPAAFPLFALSTLLLCVTAFRFRSPFLVPIAMLHGAVTWWVATIVHALGFGFDPFIHQAAEAVAVSREEFLTKPFLYAGQYGLIATLSRLTWLTTTTLDTWLVPFASAVAVTTLSYAAWKRIWRASTPSVALIAPFLLPSAAFTMTTPYGGAHLGLVAVVLTLPLAARGHGWIVPLLVALATATFHPLLGVPALALALTAITFRLRPIRALIAVPPLCVPTVLLTAFFCRDEQSVSWHGTTDALASLNALFASPYALTPMSPLSVLYAFTHLLPWLIIAVGIIGTRRITPDKRGYAILGASAAFGCFAASILLAVFVRVPGIEPLQQYEFALRLRSVLPIFFLPGLIRILELTATTVRGAILTACVVTVCAGTLWYTAYPQNTSIAHHTLPSIGIDDIRIVHAIDDLSEGRPYLVLAPQMLSAAAMREFGSNREVLTPEGLAYFYPIPTGGYLYARFLEILRSTDPDEVAEALRTTAQVDLIVVAVDPSEDGDGSVRDRLFSVATSVKSAFGYDIYAFEGGTPALH